jgi:hypothetical protein
VLGLLEPTNLIVHTTALIVKKLITFPDQFRKTKVKSPDRQKLLSKYLTTIYERKVLFQSLTVPALWMSDLRSHQHHIWMTCLCSSRYFGTSCVSKYPSSGVLSGRCSDGEIGVLVDTCRLRSITCPAILSSWMMHSESTERYYQSTFILSRLAFD